MEITETDKNKQRGGTEEGLTENWKQGDTQHIHNIQQTIIATYKLNHPRGLCNKKRKTFHVSRVMSHISHVTCRVSSFTCHLSPVTCPLSHVTCDLWPVTCNLSRVTCRGASLKDFHANNISFRYKLWSKIQNYVILTSSLFQHRRKCQMCLMRSWSPIMWRNSTDYSRLKVGKVTKYFHEPC